MEHKKIICNRIQIIIKFCARSKYADKSNHNIGTLYLMSYTI